MRAKLEKERWVILNPSKYRADYPKAHTESADKEINTNGQRLWETFDLTLIIKEIKLPFLSKWHRFYKILTNGICERIETTSWHSTDTNSKGHLAIIHQKPFSFHRLTLTWSIIKHISCYCRGWDMKLANPLSLVMLRFCSLAFSGVIPLEGEDAEDSVRLPPIFWDFPWPQLHLIKNLKAHLCL